MSRAAPIALSSNLDRDALRAAFERTGRLHIPEIFDAASAERIGEALESHPSWSLSAHASGETFEMPLERLAELDPAERARTLALTADGASTKMQYLFDTWRVGFFVDAGQRSGGAVEEAYDFLNGEAFLDFVRDITGETASAFCDAQATRYRCGHFLTAHDDLVAGRHRLLAYVLSFTRAWRPDWGGLLQFYVGPGHVAEGFAPTFNGLNLFKVPQVHAVSYVTPFAGADRLSITGWVRARPAG